MCALSTGWDSTLPSARCHTVGAVGHSHGPLVEAHPTARVERDVPDGRDRVLEPEAHVGIVGDSGGLALQPLVPPPGGLLQEADRRTGDAVLRVLVAPWSDDRLARGADGAEAFDEVEHGAGVAVGPAAHRQHGHLDRTQVLDDPIRVARSRHGAGARARWRAGALRVRCGAATSPSTDHRRWRGRAGSRAWRRSSRPIRGSPR